MGGRRMGRQLWVEGLALADSPTGDPGSLPSANSAQLQLKLWMEGLHRSFSVWTGTA
jgi:hypothetical protein